MPDLWQSLAYFVAWGVAVLAVVLFTCGATRD
jgi:hypothetical protein